MDAQTADGVAVSLQSALPFLGIAATLLIHVVSIRVHGLLGSPTFLHPLLIAITFVAVCLAMSGVPYQTYFRSAEPLHLLLGPVVVILAVPLWRNLNSIRQLGLSTLPVLTIGALAGILTAAGFAWLLGAPNELVATMAAKSVTTPVAIGLSESLGGVAALTALVVILTGLFGATVSLPVLRSIGIRDVRALGLAMGISAHAIGTARAFQINQTLGAYASLGMILNALATTLIVAVIRLSWR